MPTILKTEFISENDIEELFQGLEVGRVHYTGEVRKFAFVSAVDVKITL